MKCNKVKNPCKICFQSVTKKNGLQCQGACQKWAHFKCLNFTPGKIKDIKSGVIKITCPCPDCNTVQPKEILTDPPFTCTNTKCPANKSPICKSVDCPSNEKPIPTCPPSHCESPRPPSPPPKSSCTPPPPCLPSPKPKCPPRSPSPRDDSSPVCPPKCPSYQKVKQTKKSVSPKQSQSFSDISNESCFSERQFDKMRTVASESNLASAGVDPKNLFPAIESLCNTVGHLSNQLRNLMCKINEGYRQ